MTVFVKEIVLILYGHDGIADIFMTFRTNIIPVPVHAVPAGFHPFSGSIEERISVFGTPCCIGEHPPVTEIVICVPNLNQTAGRLPVHQII